MDPHALRPAEWSRPGHDHAEDKIAGTYTVGDNGGAQAKVYGSWVDGPSLLIADVDPPAILHGEAFGTTVTLVDCQNGGSRFSLSRQQDTTLLPRYAVEGIWLGAADLTVTRARVRMFDQQAWARWSAWCGVVNWQKSPPSVNFWRKPPRPLEANVPGGRLRLTDASPLVPAPDLSGMVLSSASQFEFEFDEPVEFDRLFSEYLMPLEFLITSATNRSSGIEALDVHHRDWKSGDGKDVWATIRTSHGPRPDNDVSFGEMLHHLADFDFARQMPAVFDVVREHRYSLEHYATLRRGRSAGYLAEFVAASQLVESYDRTLHPNDRGDRGLDARLKRMDEECGHLLDGILGNKRWRLKVARLRNIVIHGLEHSDVLARDVRSLQAGTRILLLLFEARLLVSLGFTADEVKSVVEGRATHGEIVHSIKSGYPQVVALVDRHPEAGSH